MLRDLYLGASIAISWAWGTSLILGMQIAQTKGVEAFGIWAAANCLTLAFFGQLYKRGVLTEGIIKRPWVNSIMLVIQCFCLLIQLKVLSEVLAYFIPSPLWCYALTALIGLGFVWGMYKRGLETSIFTDNFQWAWTILALLAMLGVCAIGGADVRVLPSSSASDVSWAWWSACILMSGIITDTQHWQRAKANGRGHAFEAATVFFAVYLAIVFALSHFVLPATAQALLLIAVLGVTTSTIDSVAVACHRMINKQIGSAVCSLICIAYGAFLSVGLVDLWSYFGVVRVGLAAAMLALGIKSLEKNASWRKLELEK